MAAPNWIGNATPTVDTWTGTVANTWAAGDTATISHSSGKTLVITMGSSTTTTALVADEIKRAFQSETFADATTTCVPALGGTVIPEFAVITASVSGSVVTFKADTSGVSLGTLTLSESTAGSGTFTGAHSVTASGPNWFTDTANSSTGSVPVSTDDWTIDTPISITEGLAQSAITLTSQTITPRFTSAAKIGLLKRNASGYEEYRDTELALSATTWTNRSTSSLIKQNFGSDQVTAYNYSSGVSAETGRNAVQLRGTHASNALYVFGGDVGWAANGETATLSLCRQESGTVAIGAAVTLTTMYKLAGTATVACAATTITNVEGTLTHSSGNVTTINQLGSGTFAETGSGTITTANQTAGTFTAASTTTVTTLNCSGGTATLLGTVGTIVNEGGSVTVNAGNVTSWTQTFGSGYYNGSGTITALVVENDCVVDFDGGSAACTVTTLTLRGNAAIRDTANRVTITNPVVKTGGTLSIAAP